MGQTIKVNEVTVATAAEDFSRNAQDVCDLRQTVTGIMEADLAEWKGSAADAARSTLTFANECMTELSDSIEAHSSNIRNALITMQRTDSQVASSYAAASGGIAGTAGTTIPGAYGAGLAH